MIAKKSIKNRRFAFTLAEVLITLGIIGVIAAITIPTLMNNIQDRELKTGWKKQYSVVSQAYQRMINEENGGQFTGMCSPYANTYVLSDCFKDLMAPYLNHVKDCDSLHSFNECWHDQDHFYYMSGGMQGQMGGEYAGLVLNDGAFIYFSMNSNVCTISHSDFPGAPAESCGNIYVDVNGFKKPNMIGKDVYAMIITANALKPVGYWDSGSSCNSLGTGYGCSSKYLYDE